MQLPRNGSISSFIISQIHHNNNSNDDNVNEMSMFVRCSYTSHFKSAVETDQRSIMIYSQKVRQVMQLHNNCWLLVFLLHQALRWALIELLNKACTFFLQKLPRKVWVMVFSSTVDINIGLITGGSSSPLPYPVHLNFPLTFAWALRRLLSSAIV